MAGPSAVHSKTALTALISGARGGDSLAVQRLCELLYHDLHRIARARLRANAPVTLLDTTVLVHESFLRFANLGELQVTDRAHFLAYAARVMRSIIVDFLRRRQAKRLEGQGADTELTEQIADSVGQAEDDVVRVSDALDELAQADPRAAQVVEMRYFAGMTEREIADALGVTDRTVRRDWDKARLLLKAALS